MTRQRLVGRASAPRSRSAQPRGVAGPVHGHGAGDQPDQRGQEVVAQRLAYSMISAASCSLRSAPEV